MKKRVVVKFFATLLLFALALAVLQLARYDVITGQVIQTHPSYGLTTDDLVISIDGYEPEASLLRVFYTVHNTKDEAREMEVAATLSPTDDQWSAQGAQKIVVPARSPGRYAIEMDLPRAAINDVTLTLQLEDEQTTAAAQQQISFRHNSFTGLAIFEGDSAMIAGNVVLLLACLIIAFFVITFLRRHHRKVISHTEHHIPKNRFITLDLSHPKGSKKKP